MTSQELRRLRAIDLRKYLKKKGRKENAGRDKEIAGQTKSSLPKSE